MSKHNSGVILIVVLWVLAILSLLAFGLSKRSSIDVSLMRNSIGKVRAYAAARAGINYIQSLLIKNKTKKDTLYQLGIKLEENQKPSDLFQNVKVDKDTHFDILFLGHNYGMSSHDSTVFGIEDEGSRINLNAIDRNNYKIFANLLEQFDVKEDDAKDIALAVIDWHAADGSVDDSVKDNVENSKEELKDDLDMDQAESYKPKKKPFDNVGELVFIKGMTKELFMKIKDYLTVFPKNPEKGLRINFKTAPDRVIRAFIIGQPSIGLSNDEDLVTAAILQRNGLDNRPFTSDDGSARTSATSALQQMHINALSSLWGNEASEYFRIQAVGIDESTGSKCFITAVIQRPLDQDHLKIVYWHRN